MYNQYSRNFYEDDVIVVGCALWVSSNSHIVLIDRLNDALVALCPALPSDDPLHTMSRYVRDRFDGLYAAGWELRLPGTPGCYELRLVSATEAAAFRDRRLPVMAPGAPGQHVATFASDLIGRLPGMNFMHRPPMTIRPDDPVYVTVAARPAGSRYEALRTAPRVHRDDRIMLDLRQRLGLEFGRTVHVQETRSLRRPDDGRRRIVGHFIRYALHDENVYEFDRLLFDATAAVLSLSLDELRALPRDRTIRMRLAEGDPDLVPLNSPLAWSEEIDVVCNALAFFGVDALDHLTEADLAVHRAAHGVSAPMPPPVPVRRSRGLDLTIDRPF